MTFYTCEKVCYVLSVPSGHVKIGISDDPERRLKEVQSYCYEPVTFVGATILSQSSPVPAAIMEQLMHFKLKAYASKRREWFKVDMKIVLPIWHAVYWMLSISPGDSDIERIFYARHMMGGGGSISAS